jgi:hypothetical protein
MCTGSLFVRAQLVAQAALVVLAVGRAAPAEAAHAEKQERPTDALQALVRELTALQVEVNKEDTRWQEQKAHLETTLSLLEKEKAQLDRDLASAKAEADVTQTERERLVGEIDKAEALLRATDGSVRQSGRRLLRSVEGLPEPLKKPLAAGAARVRDALFGEAGGRSVAERLQLVTAFAADLDRIMSSVHAVKQVLDMPGDERREADVLYVGSAIGYYVFPSEDHAGILMPGPEGWEVSPRDDLAPSVSRALAVFRKEKPAALVKLPMPPGESAPLEVRETTRSDSQAPQGRDDRPGKER